MPSKIDVYQIGVWFCVGFHERRLDDFRRLVGRIFSAI